MLKSILNHRLCKIDRLWFKYLSVPFLYGIKMTALQPNLFQRRFVWHTRVVEFEKKYEAIMQLPLPPPPLFPPQLVRQNARDMTHDVPRDLLEDLPYIIYNNQGDYKNHINLCASSSGAQVEYKVVLRLDDGDGLYDQENETRIFNTGEEALQFMEDIDYIKTLLPQTARQKFISHGK